jgi:galactarate dehydratase
MDAKPRLIRMHAADNVAIVANDGGLAAGAAPRSKTVPRCATGAAGHKVSLVDIPSGGAMRRYDVPSATR